MWIFLAAVPQTVSRSFFFRVWAVLDPYIKSEYVEAFAWPPRPGSEIAAEIERKGWANAFEPFSKTRHFVAAKGRSSSARRHVPCTTSMKFACTR